MAEPARLTLISGDPPLRPWIRLLWSGDVDAYTVRPLAAELRDSWAVDPLVLEVDLAGVTFMDTAGIRPLVEAHAHLLHRMRLFDPAPAVTRLLELLGLYDMFIVVRPVPAGPSAQAEPHPAPDLVLPPGAAVVRGKRPLTPSVDGDGLPWAHVDHVVVEQAKGLLMATHGCDEVSAWDILCIQAETHGIPTHAMARLLVAHAPSAVPGPSHAGVERVDAADVMAERARAGPPAD